MNPVAGDWFTDVTGGARFSFHGRVRSVSTDSVIVDWYINGDIKYPATYLKENFARLVLLGRFVPRETDGGVL